MFVYLRMCIFCRTFAVEFEINVWIYMKKKGLTFAMLLLLLTFAISSCDDYKTKYFIIGDYTFRAMSSDEVELTYVNNTSITSASLPPTISHLGVTYRVTSIGTGAFYDYDALTSITIPESITSIGEMAFYECSSLTSINIGNSVTSIGDYAFYDCSSLTSITIPNSVTSIGNNAFSLCFSLTSATIGNSVTSIGEEAFDGCLFLTSITIPNSVTSIGDKAFSWCISLTSMVVASGNSTYDSRDNCNAIIETATNTLIAGSQNTTIPNSVTSIGEEAFADCSSLTSITIPNCVTSIGSDAFEGCSNLTSITIPNSVTSIGEKAFGWCGLLKAVDYAGTKAQWEKIKKENCMSCSSIRVIRCTDGEIVID